MFGVFRVICRLNLGVCVCVCVCVCVYIYIYMFGVFRAICRLNLGVCVCVCMCIYILSQVQPADGSDKPKHVAKSCKFIKYLIKMLC